MVGSLIIEVLKKAEANGELMSLKEQVEFDIAFLIRLLENMQNNRERINLLSMRHPDLCIFVMKKHGMEEELRQYMEKNRVYESDHTNYSFYIRGYWLPYL